MSIATKFSRRVVVSLLAAAACGAWADAPYPNKTIRMVVPFAAGGPNDIMGRILAQQLSVELKQPVIVENKAGAGGVIGTDMVAKSNPDGYTLAFISGPFTMAPALRTNMPYDTVKDLVAISKVAESPMVMMVPSTSKFKTAKELMEFARKNPEKLSYGSGGVGSTPHLSTELLGLVTGAKMMHVPYKGGGESIKALMSGEIDMLIDSITSTAGPIGSGRVKAVAVAQVQQNPKLPGVPTFEESGIQNFSMTHWVGVVAPANTPAAIVSTLNSQIVKALKDPEVAKKFQDLGAKPIGDSSSAFQKFIADETKGWKQTVKSANIQAQ